MAQGTGTVTDLTGQGKAKDLVDVGGMDALYHGILKGVGEDPEREGLLK
ncbi:MAG: hypothetical protein JOZ57_14955, partial [Abitibacteriaceae bacterium]|nr:hypothetical protein [Abditibacteriaceae bacterium]